MAARVRAVFIAAVLVTGSWAAAGDEIGDRGGCVFCQEGDVVEMEPDCGVPIDTTNGGCNSKQRLYTPLFCGQTVCGNSAVLVIPPDPNFDPNEPNSPGGEQQCSDQDWYEFTITEPNTRFRFAIQSNFIAGIEIVQDCNSAALFDDTVYGCISPLVMQGCLEPGTYRLSIIHQFGFELGCGTNYRFTFECGPCIAPDNDPCAGAIDVALNSTVFGSTASATGDPDVPFCRTTRAAPGVWYRVTGNGNEFIATTCHPATTYDADVSVYCGTDCSDLVCVDGSDDDPNCFESGYFPPDARSTVRWCSAPGQTYWIRVGGFNNSQGDYGLVVFDTNSQCATPPTCAPPANDECEDAETVGLPSLTLGSTRTATIDAVTSCGTTITGAGVWYRVIGDGSTLTASTCNLDTDYDVKLNVYCADCDALTCIVGRDDSCSRQVEVSWCTQPGAAYLILVQGYNGDSGNFGLSLTSTGSPCVPTIVCEPSGACCVQSNCILTNVGNCAQLGGSFRGPNSVCEGVQYTLSDGASPFEDITSGGTLSSTSNCDDCGEVVSLPFSFPFYDNAYNIMGISSNGFVQFGATVNLTARLNVLIPNTTVPNNMICGLWDDINPNAGNGEVRYASRANPTRFIVQWKDVPQFRVDDSNTLQIVLFPNGAIELRYGLITAQVSGDATVGLENSDGLAGYNIPNTGLGTGNTQLRFDRSIVDDPCACADITGDGQVGLSDLATLLTNFGVPSGASRSQGDLDADGDVDLSDLATMLAQFGSAC